MGSALAHGHTHQGATPEEISGQVPPSSAQTLPENLQHHPAAEPPPSKGSSLEKHRPEDELGTVRRWGWWVPRGSSISFPPSMPISASLSLLFLPVTSRHTLGAGAEWSLSHHFCSCGARVYLQPYLPIMPSPDVVQVASPPWDTEACSPLGDCRLEDMAVSAGPRGLSIFCLKSEMPPHTQTHISDFQA